MPTTSRPRAVATEQIRRRLARVSPAGDDGGTQAEVAAGDGADTGDGAGAPGSGDVPTGPSRRGPRIEPGRPGLVLLCAVALVAAAASAALTWAGRPDPSPVPVAAVVSPGLPIDAAGTAGTAGPAETDLPPTVATSVVVAVVGEVVTPGLVTLPLGSRVADAVAAAGGARPGADLSTVNLARVLVDGEQIAVGVPGAPAPPGATGAPAGGPALVDLNTATEAELEDLPGVGPVLAGRIVAYRDDNGGFTAVEELQEVSGIGPSTYAELEDAVTV